MSKSSDEIAVMHIRELAPFFVDVRQLLVALGNQDERFLTPDVRVAVAQLKKSSTHLAQRIKQATGT